MTEQIRTFSQLIRLKTFEERFEYLALRGNVGERTFGSERYLNQRFYRSTEWKRTRDYVISRDEGFDLASNERPINGPILIHHMNPMTARDIVHSNHDILNPEFLISTVHRTHNAIHYGDSKLLAKSYVERTPGDTRLW